MNQTALYFCFLAFAYNLSYGQGIIKGQVTGADGPLPFVNIGLVGTDKGTNSDEDGKYFLKNLPSGYYKLLFSSVGFLPAEKELNIQNGQTVEMNIILQKSFMELHEIVITGTRNETKKTDSPVIVGIISSKSLENTQSNNLAEGLNFQSGLRMETDCQTCGYSQLRINGLGGAYSQILINGRPVFNSLMGLYGLEQIPVSIIDRIEVVKGGGSAIYGSSAIAGTVNVITKIPMGDEINAGLYGGLIDGQSAESNINAVLIKTIKKAGISLNINSTNREAYDANGDGFSEMPKIVGLNIGMNANLPMGKYANMGVNVNSIHEYRRGGNKIEEPAHMTDQSEERTHDILLGGLDYNWSMPSIMSSASAYISGQHTRRVHYTGIDGVDAYGDTQSSTIMGGLQYNFLPKSHTLTLGMEYLYDDIFDEIPYYNYLINQQTYQLGIFLQEEWRIVNRISLLGGARLDLHNFVSKPVFNPRINLLVKPFKFTQVRIGYATGFRAPQAFDADLHIAFAGGGVSIISLDPELMPENSNSFSASLNFDKPSEKAIYGFTIDAFYTRLQNAFVLENTGTDSLGNMQIQKTNGGASTVNGVSLEARANYNDIVEGTAGITLQTSYYDKPVQWSEDMEGTTNFLRTPNEYGYVTIDITPGERLAFSYSGVFTGNMLVPHFAGAPGISTDKLTTSGNFYDQSIRLSYTFPIPALKAGLELFGGVKNILNAYQDDFDIGKNRDSNYIYGPARPRTIYLGLKFNSFNAP